MSLQIIQKYFSDLSQIQTHRFEQLEELYRFWNERINVISRRSIDHLYEKHILHSLGIAKVQTFEKNADILDVGTGGGFPGIPLAILFEDVNFHLVDSIGKKIKVVEEITKALGLKNVKTIHQRVETIRYKFDFIISRAVTYMPDFVKWVDKKVKKTSKHSLKNGILYLKGGDLTEELRFFSKVSSYNLSDFFEEFFFQTKKVIHLPL